MEEFKYKVFDVVYNLKNGKRGMISQRVRIGGEPYYLFRADGELKTAWMKEADLGDKSIRERLFGAEKPSSAFAVEQFKKEYVSAWSDGKTSLTGVEAVEMILNINEQISDLQSDLAKAHTITGQHLLKGEISILQTEHDKIMEQLKQVRIHYKSVR